MTKEERSRHMAKIRGKNSRIELLLFNLLEQRNVSFERHCRNLTGSPDVVFNECKVAVFVDGDFWHGRRFALWKDKLNAEWKVKIENNIKRDRRTDRLLRRQGWSVLHLWGKDLLRHPDRSLKRILNVRKRKLKRREAKEFESN